MKYHHLIIIVLLVLPVITLAAPEYRPLVGIPGVSNPNTDFNSYVKSLYVLSISVAGLLAVVKVIMAGVKYMTTDIVTQKGDAKKDIQQALIGLLVVLSAVVILTTINPQLVNVNLSLGEISTHPSTETQTPPGALNVGYVENNIAYSAILLSSPGDQIQIFNDTCVAAGKTLIFLDGLARCYNTEAGETFSRIQYCTAAAGSCGEKEVAAREDCINTKGADTDGFLVDPQNYQYAICIYPQ